MEKYDGKDDCKDRLFSALRTDDEQPGGPGEIEFCKSMMEKMMAKIDCSAPCEQMMNNLAGLVIEFKGGPKN